MNSRERMLAALDRNRLPDHLPATSHHLMGYFLNKYMDGISYVEFFDRMGMDHWVWSIHNKPASEDQYMDPDMAAQDPLTDFLCPRRVVTDNWRIYEEELPEPDPEYVRKRHRFVTPKGELSMITRSSVITTWVTERLIKRKEDLDLFEEFAPASICDDAAIRQAADQIGNKGLVRGNVACAEVFGQPGCWQDAACLFGIENLIFATKDDPNWVHRFLTVLQRRKMVWMRSLAGVPYDILELGGGDASSTVISPRLFDRFVAPYDKPLIDVAHEMGQRIVYHTCGGMMPMLERIVAMGPDAIETLTPPGMGGDVDIAAAKRRVGDKVAFIGGLDQLHFFTQCTEEQTRAEVRRLFEGGGTGGGFIISPSDHFFDAEPHLIAAFADEARKCAYT